MIQCTLVDLLIRRLLQWTRNSNLISPSGAVVQGLNEEYILQALNSGKQNIQVAVAKAQPKAFMGFVVEEITSRAREQDVPEKIINTERIVRVDYCSTNNDLLFYKLNRIDPAQWSYAEGSPCEYFTTDGKIVLNPSPSSGYLRYLAQIKDDRLDPRRGTIESVSVPGGEVASITLASDAYRNTVNNGALDLTEYVCVSDYQGNVIAYDLPVESYDSSSRVITIRSGYEDPTTLAAGQYVTAGKRTSTHSKLKIEFESYYLEWAKFRIMNHDANDQAVDDIPVIQTLRENLIESYAENADLDGIVEFGNFLGNWNG